MSSRPASSGSSLARRVGNRAAVRITVTGLALLLFLAVNAYVTFLLGHVRGEEVAPATFQRREFAYFQVPLIEWQITGITHTDSTGDLEDYLIKEKLITVAIPKTPPDETLRWDLVRAHLNGVLTSRGEAEILCNYLDSEDADGNNLWVEWSKANPELAKVIWPEVLSVSQRELYIFVPDLLALAADASDPVDLKQKLDELLPQKYVQIATTQQQLARHELAVELFSFALDREPQKIDALERRATSLAALGQQDEAAADLAQARDLKRF